MMPKPSLVSVVDDDESMRESLPDLLRQFGFAAEAFSSAEEFLASEFVGETSCLLLDVAMPGMDGLEAMRQIKAKKPSMVVVIASAHSMAGDRERFLAAGANDVLSKPFRLNDLTSVVDKLVGGATPPGGAVVS